MGQFNSVRGGIEILYTNKVGAPTFLESLITGCSIHDCGGMCINAVQSQKVKLVNNVIHKGERFLIQNLESPKEWTI